MDEVDDPGIPYGAVDGVKDAVLADEEIADVPGCDGDGERHPAGVFRSSGGRFDVEDADVAHRRDPFMFREVFYWCREGVVTTVHDQFPGLEHGGRTRIEESAEGNVVVEKLQQILLEERQLDQAVIRGQFAGDGQIFVDPPAKFFEAAVGEPLFQDCRFDFLIRLVGFGVFPLQAGGQQGGQTPPHRFGEHAAGKEFRHGRMGGKGVQLLLIERIERCGEVQNPVGARGGDGEFFKQFLHRGGFRNIAVALDERRAAGKTRQEIQRRAVEKIAVDALLEILHRGGEIGGPLSAGTEQFRPVFRSFVPGEILFRS